jgi:hypothetical protein
MSGDHEISHMDSVALRPSNIHRSICALYYLAVSNESVTYLFTIDTHTGVLDCAGIPNIDSFSSAHKHDYVIQVV